MSDEESFACPHCDRGLIQIMIVERGVRRVSYERCLVCDGSGTLQYRARRVDWSWPSYRKEKDDDRRD